MSSGIPLLTAGPTEEKAGVIRRWRGPAPRQRQLAPRHSAKPFDPHWTSQTTGSGSLTANESGAIDTRAEFRRLQAFVVSGIVRCGRRDISEIDARNHPADLWTHKNGINGAVNAREAKRCELAAMSIHFQNGYERRQHDRNIDQGR